MRLETELAHPLDDAFDLFFRGVRLSDDDHGAQSGNTIMSPGTTKRKQRAAGFPREPF